MSRSIRNKHPHSSRKTCSVCHLGGGAKTRRRALAAEGVPVVLYPEPMPDDDIWNDRGDDSVYWPDWVYDLLDAPQRPLAVPLIEGARFA